MPVAERKAPVLLVVAWMVLMLVHAGVYEFGDRIRSRFVSPATQPRKRRRCSRSRWRNRRRHSHWLCTWRPSRS